MKYPADCDSPRKKTEYLYRALEKLRLLHNVFVEWREVGLTKARYNELPAAIKANFPHKNKIDLDTQKEFLREDFEPVEIARIYEASGACVLSILTDKKFFQGDITYLKSVREALNLPILRKDFIIDKNGIECK